MGYSFSYAEDGEFTGDYPSVPAALQAARGDTKRVVYVGRNRSTYSAMGQLATTIGQDVIDGVRERMSQECDGMIRVDDSCATILGEIIVRALQLSNAVTGQLVGFVTEHIVDVAEEYKNAP